MKILAPLRSLDEVEALCAAGADEFYCGLSPAGWETAFGSASVHRRNARAAGVRDLDELQRIVAQAGDRPVFATLNAPSYPAGAVGKLADFAQVLLGVGVSALIVAEHGNLPYPEGTACADVLVAGEKGGKMAGLVFGGVAVAAVYKALNSIFAFWKEAVTFATGAKSKLPNATISSEISPEYLGVGYILGPRIGGIMVSGSILAWVVLFIAPAVAISVFWLVHILPEKIAEKRHHPQAPAIKTLCLLSLFFGGMLWPLAWLWAYSKPVLYKMAYGRDVEEPVPTQDDSLVPRAEAPESLREET